MQTNMVGQSCREDSLGEGHPDGGRAFVQVGALWMEASNDLCTSPVQDPSEREGHCESAQIVVVLKAAETVSAPRPTLELKQSFNVPPVTHLRWNTMEALQKPLQVSAHHHLGA